MDISITIRGIDNDEAGKLSNSIRNYIIEQRMGEVEKLLNFVKEPIFINITVTIVKPHPMHSCNLRIYGPGFEVIITKDNGPEIYKIIDQTFDEAIEKIIQHKDKIVTERKSGKPN